MNKKLIPITAILMAVGLSGCPKKKQTEETRQSEPVRMNKKSVACEAVAEVPVYEIKVRRGDSLGRFVHSAQSGARFHVKPDAFDPTSCIFTDVGRNYHNGSAEEMPAKSKYEIVESANAVADLNGIPRPARGVYGFEPHMEEVNKELFHPGKKVLIPAFELVYAHTFHRQSMPQLKKRGKLVGKMIATCNPGRAINSKAQGYNVRYQPSQCSKIKYRLIRGK